MLCRAFQSASLASGSLFRPLVPSTLKFCGISSSPSRYPYQSSSKQSPRIRSTRARPRGPVKSSSQGQLQRRAAIGKIPRLATKYSFGTSSITFVLCLATVGSRPANFAVLSPTSSNLLPISLSTGVLNAPSSPSTSWANSRSSKSFRTRVQSAESRVSDVSFKRRRSSGETAGADEEEREMPPDDKVRRSSAGVWGKRAEEKLWS